jgi:hypothetical protein
MDLISLLVTLIIVGLIFYLLYWLIGQIPMPAPIKTVCLVVLGLIIVIYLLNLLFGLGLPRLRFTG